MEKMVSVILNILCIPAILEYVIQESGFNNIHDFFSQK